MPALEPFRDWKTLRLDPRVAIAVATKNRHKFAEISRLWDSFLPPIAIAGERYPDVDEHGETYECNALLKAAALAESMDQPALADDSGIEVEALGWGPGVRSARTPYEGAPPAERNQNILRAVEGKSKAARFVSVCVLLVPGFEPIIARGEVEGLIAARPLGNNGFGYDPIFWYPPYQATFGQVQSSLKDSVSHRGCAIRSLKKQLTSLQM